jgi:uncharacterized protein DUF6130
MRKPGRVVGILVPLSVAVYAAACGGGGGPSPTATLGARPTSTAKLSIVSPTNGQVVHGSSLELKTRLEGARIVPATSTNLRPDEGHVHVILDDSLVTMTAELQTHLADLTPGQHVLQVEFVANDHAPFNPRVIDKVSFEVAR